MNYIQAAREELLRIDRTLSMNEDSNSIHAGKCARDALAALDSAKAQDEARAQIAAATSPEGVSELSKQLLTLDPMYTNPSCLWRRDEKREAIIFNRDHMGVEVLRIVGDSSRIDHLARLLASIQAAALEAKP